MDEFEALHLRIELTVEACDPSLVSELRAETSFADGLSRLAKLAESDEQDDSNVSKIWLPLSSLACEKLS
jgi:hypothetical protein